jgi:hypothetical protein
LARKSRLERIKNEHIKEIMWVKGKPDIIEKTTTVWPCQKDAREQNNKINYGMGTRGEMKKRTS